MQERIWRLKKKVGFLRPQSKVDKIKKAEADLVKAEGLQKILTNKDWPIVRVIFDDLRSQVVSELSRRGLESKDMERLNHRLELLKDIDNAFDSIMKHGTDALKILEKLKEKSDDRSASN